MSFMSSVISHLADFRSRLFSSKQYILWIQFTESTISAWYCKCHADARVVGVCSHIASVLWYLGFARHNNCKSQNSIELILELLSMSLLYTCIYNVHVC
jgi:hypothetical protein